MFRPDPSLACDRAGKATLRPNDGHKKAPGVTAKGRYSIRTTGSPPKAPVALRNPPKHDFEVSRHETIC